MNWQRSVFLGTCDDGDQTMAVDAGGDLLSRRGAREARGPFAVEPPHQAADPDGSVAWLPGMPD